MKPPTMSTIGDDPGDQEPHVPLADWAGQPAYEPDPEKRKMDDVVTSFLSTRKLHERMLLLSMAPCLCALAVTGCRFMFAFCLVSSLLGLALRATVARMHNQRMALRICGWFAFLTANCQWFVYHTLTDGPTAFNLRPFLLLLGTAYMCFYGIAGTLVTTPTEHVGVTVVVLCHNAYAQSRVPAELKLFSDLEALVSTVLLLGGVLVYYFHEAPAERARLEAETTAKEAAEVAAELDRQVMALERSRREALVNSMKGQAAAGGGVMKRAWGSGTSRAAREKLASSSIPEAAPE